MYYRLPIYEKKKKKTKKKKRRRRKKKKKNGYFFSGKTVNIVSALQKKLFKKMKSGVYNNAKKSNNVYYKSYL